MKDTGRSYWESVLYDQHYDLIVIGAGLTGQSLAWFYKKEQPKAKVLVLDRGFYPLGASTRNAGFACFGSVTEHMADMEIEEEAKIIDRIRRRYEGLQLLRNTLGDASIDYTEPGGYEIFKDDAIYEQALDHLQLCNDWLYEATGNKEVYSACTYQGYSAIRIDLEGALHPGKMMKTLYEKNLRAGVDYRWQSTVTEVDTHNGAVVVNDDIELKANHIAIATNSFTSKLLPKSGIKPGRGYVFVTRPIPGLTWKGTFHYDRGYYYFRNIGTNRLLLGGARSLDTLQEETMEFGVNEKIKEHLVSFASNTLNLPKGWEIEQEWSGIMGFTETKSPMLKRQGEKGLLVAGLSGMGVALGMQLGKEGAQKLFRMQENEIL